MAPITFVGEATVTNNYFLITHFAPRVSGGCRAWAGYARRPRRGEGSFRRGGVIDENFDFGDQTIEYQFFNNTPGFGLPSLSVFGFAIEVDQDFFDEGEFFDEGLEDKGFGQSAIGDVIHIVNRDDWTAATGNEDDFGLIDAAQWDEGIELTDELGGFSTADLPNFAFLFPEFDQIALFYDFGLLNLIGPGGSSVVGDPAETVSDFLIQGPALPNSEFVAFVTDNTNVGACSSVDESCSIPEPVTAAMFGVGLIGLGYLRRRKRR